MPSSDIGTDLQLMYQTIMFQTDESLGMLGCRACYGKSASDVVGERHDACDTFVINDRFSYCGSSPDFMKKAVEIEKNNDCKPEQWRYDSFNNTFDQSECDVELNDECCIVKLVQESNHKRKCRDVCGVHIDFIKSGTNDIIYTGDETIDDFSDWISKTIYLWFPSPYKLGGWQCTLLTMYGYLIVLPIALNFLFCFNIFVEDVKSGKTKFYEFPFLLILFYPQWRTIKCLFRYVFHKNEAKLTKELDENERDVSFIEPFCESTLQVSLILVSIELLSI